MGASQPYYIAQVARSKLLSEADRADHNLRQLVGHANLLDSLLLHLAEIGQEQDSRSNHAARGPTGRRHIKWADNVAEEAEEDCRTEVLDSSDSDNDYSSDEEVD